MKSINKVLEEIKEPVGYNAAVNLMNEIINKAREQELQLDNIGIQVAPNGTVYLKIHGHSFIVHSSADIDKSIAAYQEGTFSGMPRYPNTDPDHEGEMIAYAVDIVEMTDDIMRSLKCDQATILAWILKNLLDATFYKCDHSYSVILKREEFGIQYFNFRVEA